MLYPVKDELNEQSIQKEQTAEKIDTTSEEAIEQQRDELNTRGMKSKDQETSDKNVPQKHETTVQLRAEEPHSCRDEIQKEIEKLYGEVWKKNVNSEEVGDIGVMMKVRDDMQSLKYLRSCESRTAKLWILYSNYIEIVRLYIHAERTSDWEMHLHATGKMLNLFAATGHIHYAKSCRMYLQTMLELPSKHPWLHEHFAVKNLFTVRGSQRYWAGLWTDLTIEQVLMRSLKNRGGMTRGRGMTEGTRILWIYSMHQCASLR